MKELPPWLSRIAERHPLAEAAGLVVLLLAALCGYALLD